VPIVHPLARVLEDEDASGVTCRSKAVHGSALSQWSLSLTQTLLTSLHSPVCGQTHSTKGSFNTILTWLYPLWGMGPGVVMIMESLMPM